MTLRCAFLGAKQRSERVLRESPLDPELVLSLDGLGDRGATYEEYGNSWATVSSINRPEVKALLEEADVDIAFVVSWPELLDETVLDIPEYGCIGRHISLLPRRRGRAPVAWALIQNLEETGVTLFWLDEGVDTGDIALQQTIPIAGDDEAHDLYEKATDATIALLSDLRDRVEAGDVPREPQDDSEATYTHPRRPDMGLIDWSKTAAKLHNFVRGQTHPYPGAFTYNAMDTVRVWHADVVNETRIDDVPGRIVERVADDTYVVQTGEGQLEVQIENEDGAHPVTVGDRLGCTF